jgi:alpha-galactosidase
VEAELTVEELDRGVVSARLRLAQRHAGPPKPLSLSFRYPLDEVHGLWMPDHGGASTFDRSLAPPWGSVRISATRGAPVCCAFTQSGVNRLTYAWSDASSALRLETVVVEETAELGCAIRLFDPPAPPLERYEAALRIDTRPLPYYEALDAVQEWWATMPEYTPAPVPAVAREPVYSTWYSFHLGIDAEIVEEQCRLAKALGCASVIVDDGWQTETVDRGYTSCGDWRPAPTKFPDLRDHVRRVQAMGLAYILWFALPFVGERSERWHEVRDRLLSFEPSDWEGRWGVLDPRFPDVREHIASTYERAVREWGLDGLKLDFVDELHLREGDRFGQDRDIDSLPLAAERLLEELVERSRAINPDLAVEFRQTSTGPVMRRFATMFRALDCPGDALENRVRTLTLRLLAGATPVHSDMLTWSPSDGVESAAAQLLNVLFAVPQISVRLDRIPEDHRRMLRFWLAFWREHRPALLDGRLRPLKPELNYPLVFAESADELVVAVYGREAVPLTGTPPATYVLNATGEERLVLELAKPSRCRIVVRNCTGELVEDRRCELPAGFQALAVPRSGLLELSG